MKDEYDFKVKFLVLVLLSIIITLSLFLYASNQYTKSDYNEISRQLWIINNKFNDTINQEICDPQYQEQRDIIFIQDNMTCIINGEKKSTYECIKFYKND